MEYRPHSRPQRSPDIPPEPLIHTLPEHYVMSKAITRWSGPKHITYDTCEPRIPSYFNWPHGMNPAPESQCVLRDYFIRVRTKYSFRLNAKTNSLTNHYITFSYRTGWPHGMFPLWRRLTLLIIYWWRVGGTCKMVSILRIFTIC